MNERINREQLISQVSQRTGQEIETVTMIVDAFLDEMYQTIRQGNSVMIQNFGSFFVRAEPGSWIFKFNPSQKWRAALLVGGTHDSKR